MVEFSSSFAAAWFWRDGLFSEFVSGRLFLTGDTQATIDSSDRLVGPFDKTEAHLLNPRMRDR